MKRLSFLLALIFVCSINDAFGQRVRENQEESEVESKLWYGATIASPSFFNGTFLMAIEPMIGYKIDPKGNFSVGPKVSLEYISLSRTISPNFERISSFNYGVGGFARAKIYRGYFALVEYEKINAELTTVNNNIVLLDSRRWIDNYFVGAGINGSAGGWSGEVSIVVNLNTENSIAGGSFEYRLGITRDF